MPSGGPRRAARRDLLRRERPRRTTEVRRRALGADGRDDLGLLLAARDGGENLVEPETGLVLVHPLRVHQLAGEDLLRLDEHLLLARREPLLVVAQRQVPNDLRELEDVAGLHLVAVVLEAPIPV